MSKVVADTTHTPLFERYAYNWARERFSTTKDSSGVYILTGLLYEYQKINPNALAQNKIRVINNKYYDKYINGTWQNPYETQKTFALSPPILHSRSKDVYFKLPNELFLTNLGSQINTIQMDADNGQGYQNLPFDTAVPLQFYQNKIHDLSFKITLNNGQTLYCRSKFKIDDPVLDNPFTTITKSSSNVVNRVYITQGNNPFNGAWLTIRRISGNNEITRPLIIAEGLDTGNFTAPEDFGGENTLNGFLDDLDFAGGQLRTLIDAGDFNHDYDLIYIDWARGMADLRDNSGVLEEVIKWVNANKTATAEPNVLLGQSMGGVIGRYTLARMENAQATNPSAPDHDVRLFIAHDSPMQGANFPLGFSHFSAHMKQEYVSTPIAFLSGEVLLPIGLGLAQLGENFLNIFGNNDNIPPFVSPAQLLSLQDQTASRQLNYWSVEYSNLGGYFGSDHSQTNMYNLAWQQTLENEGWPQDSRNIAISNGNECGVDNGFAPGDPLLTIDSSSNPGFLLDVMNMFLAPYVGFHTLDPGLFILGLVPGSSTWQSNFDIHSYGNQGAQNQIYRGRIRYEKRMLWIGPNISYDLTNESFDAPSQALPFDTFSGGTLEFLDDEGEFNQDIPIIEDLVDVINESIGFIPVVSALDIKKVNGNDPTPNDYLKSYSGGMPSDPNLISGFDAFIVDNQPDQPTNNEHLTFQVRNGNWLADELQAESPADYPIVEDCSFYCSIDLNITGSNLLCNGSTSSYTLLPDADNYTWQITSGGALATINSSSNNTVSLTASSNSSLSGYVVLEGTINSTRCEFTASVEKEIYIGKPSFSNSTISGLSNAGCNSIYIYEFTGIINGIYDTQWITSPQFDDVSVGNGDELFIDPTNGGEGYVTFVAYNQCGEAILCKPVDVNGQQCGPDYLIIPNQYSCVNTGRASTFYYNIYPNPTSYSLTIEEKENIEQGPKPSDEEIKYELFDFNHILKSTGNFKSKIDLDLSGYNTGKYILRISFGSNSESHHLIIN